MLVERLEKQIIKASTLTGFKCTHCAVGCPTGSL